jgi:hypothetical protein
VGRETVLLAGRNFLVRSGALVDTCKIERRSGEVTVGTVVTPTFATVYTGACRVQAAAANWAGPTDVAEAALRLASFELQLPVVGSEGLRIDDRVTILTCLNDTDLVNRVFTITGASRKSHATTRKLPLLEVLS